MTVAQADAERADRRTQQLAADLDHERAEVSRLTAELSAVQQALAAAEAQSKANADLVARADTDAARERDRATDERNRADHLAAKAAEAERIASLGWRARRKALRAAREG